jgi:hypothetical protein
MLFVFDFLQRDGVKGQNYKNTKKIQNNCIKQSCYSSKQNGARSRNAAYCLFISARKASRNQSVARLQLSRQSLPEVLANFFIHVADPNLAETLDQV